MSAIISSNIASVSSFFSFWTFTLSCLSLAIHSDFSTLVCAVFWSVLFGLLFSIQCLCSEVSNLLDKSICWVFYCRCYIYHFWKYSLIVIQISYIVLYVSYFLKILSVLYLIYFKLWVLLLQYLKNEELHFCLNFCSILLTKTCFFGYFLGFDYVHSPYKSIFQLIDFIF